MATTLYLVRHGDVENPKEVLYGRLAGFGLSTTGRRQLEQAAGRLLLLQPLDGLYTSPMQRAQECRSADHSAKTPAAHSHR